MLTAFRGKVASKHNNNGEFNTSVKAMDRLSLQKTNKESQDFSDTTDQINWNDVYRHCSWKQNILSSQVLVEYSPG